MLKRNVEDLRQIFKMIWNGIFLHTSKMVGLSGKINVWYMFNFCEVVVTSSLADLISAFRMFDNIVK